MTGSRWPMRVEHPPAVDIALAVGLALFAVAEIALTSDWRGPRPVNLVIVPSAALALAWRRRIPLATLLLSLGPMTLLAVLFQASQAWSSVLIAVVAVYSAAAYAASLPLVVLVAATAVAIRDVRDPLITSVTDALWSSSVLGLTLLAGVVGRATYRRDRDLAQRAAALDREESAVAAAAAEEERRRIARELHDIISHALGVLVLQAGAAEQVLERDPDQAREVLRSIRIGGQDAIREMGTLLGLVRGEPDASREPQPSLADIDRLVTTMRESGLSVDLRIEGEPRPLPAALELSAFRVVQEGLTNVAKHATSSRAVVILRYGAGALEVDVLDDGAAVPGAPGGRRGLAGLRERLAVFGGQFAAGPREDGGWALHAAFPVSR